MYIARTLDFWFWLNVSPRDGRDMTLAAEGFALAVPDMILYNCDRNRFESSTDSNSFLRVCGLQYIIKID